MDQQRLMRDLLKFGLVGAGNTLVSLCVFNSVLYLTQVRQGWLVGVITFIAYVAGITNSFFWNKWWVFRHGGSGKGKSEYIRFFAVSGVVAVLGASIVSLLTTYMHPADLSPLLWANIAVILTLPFSLIGNFFGYKLFVFDAESV